MDHSGHHSSRLRRLFAQHQHRIRYADSRPRLSRIGVPTLVLCGAQDRTCPPAMSITIAEAIPHARLKIVPDAGHYLPLERPDLVAHELTAWLAMPVPHTAKEPS